MSFMLVSQLLRGKWFMNEMDAFRYGPIVKSVLEGMQLPAPVIEKKQTLPYFISMNTDPNETGNGIEDTSSEPLQNGSVMVIPVVGPIFKYDVMCGPVGTATLTEYLKQAEADDRVKGVVLNIDSPGGMVDGTKSMADAVRDFKKPIVAFINDGTAASAAYYIAAAADEIVASQPTDVVGSIGVMVEFADVRPMWEKEGVKFHTVYADQSSEKNKVFDEALKGNYKRLKKDLLNPVAQEFIDFVKDARGSKLNMKEEGVLSGAVFTADLALANGLIDRIGTMESALISVKSMSDAATLKKKKEPTMKFSASLKNILSFLNIKSEEAESTDVTAAHIEALEAEIATVPALKAQLEIVTAQVETLMAENANLSEEKNAIQLALGELSVKHDEEIAALNAKIEKLSKMDGAKPDETAKEGQDIHGGGDKIAGMDHVDWTASHNKDLAQRLGYEIVNGVPVKQGE